MALLAPTRSAWLLARAYGRLLDEVPAPDAWASTVRAAAAKGPVVFVVRNESLLDAVTLDHLTRRLGLVRHGFIGEIETDRLVAALGAGQAALLFLKRPPTVLDRAAPGVSRGTNEGDEHLRALVALQRRIDKPIQVVPQLFVWTQRPERLGFSLVDTLLGPAEFPGDLRSAGQFLFNHKNGVVRAGEPIDLREMIASEKGESDATIGRRLGYSILRKLERERRAVLGPAHKPADRVREEVLRSPKLQAVIRDLAGPDDAQRAALEDKARLMLDELAATPDPPTLRGLEIAADTLVDRVYAGVDVDQDGIERVREAAKKGSLVLLPSHKSHVDYMLLSFVFRKNALQIPAIAAGDNLAFFPIGPLFRNAGAFFIRRSFKGDRLYMSVVDAYVRRLIRDGFTIEFFLEGGRSRQGKLLAPKLGLLNMVVDAALGVEHRAVSFVPVSIGYERTIEAGSYARELSGGEKKKEDAAALLKLGEILRDKYGRANVQFGQVLDLDELCKQQGTERGAMPPPKRRALVTRLAHRVMDEINRVTAVTAGSLVATVLLTHGRRGLPHAELVEHVARLVQLVVRLGARTAPGLTRASSKTELREGAVRDAAILYVRGGLVRQHVPGDTLTGTAKQRARIYTGDDVIYTVPDEQRIVLDIPKNIIIHLFVDRALVSIALLAPPGPALPRAELGQRVQSLSRLFKHEFMFRADASFEKNFAETIADMVKAGELAIEGAGDALVGFGPGHDGLDGRGWIAFYASVIKNFVESYRVAARAVRVLDKTPLTEKDLATRALRIGEQMFLGGEIERAEAVSQPVFENAFSAFVDQGYLSRRSGKLVLAPTFAGEQEAEAIEGTIAAYLRRRSGQSSF